jgi:hypothetical protein
MNQPIYECGVFTQLGNLKNLGDERDVKSSCSSGIIYSGFRKIISRTIYVELQTLSSGNIQYKTRTWNVGDKGETEATEIITDKHSDRYLRNSEMHEKLQTNGTGIITYRMK